MEKSKMKKHWINPFLLAEGIIKNGGDCKLEGHVPASCGCCYFYKKYCSKLLGTESAPEIIKIKMGFAKKYLLRPKLKLWNSLGSE